MLETNNVKNYLINVFRQNVQVGGANRIDLPMAVGNNSSGDRRTTPTDSHHHGHHHHGHHHGATSNGHQFSGSGASTNGDQSQLQIYDVK